jgi:uncharacterized cupredoxin-like copper-binding protein
MKNNYGSDDESVAHIASFDKMSKDEQNAVIMNPGHVDEATWEKAKKAAAESGHAEKWPLIMYLYEKMGGK